ESGFLQRSRLQTSDGRRVGPSAELGSIYPEPAFEEYTFGRTPSPAKVRSRQPAPADAAAAPPWPADRVEHSFHAPRRMFTWPAEVDACSGTLEMLSLNMKHWGYTEWLRQEAEKVNQQCKPEPPKTTWA